MPLERNIEKVPVTCGVLEVFDPRSFLPRCSVASDLVEEAQLTLAALLLAVDIHPGAHG